MALKEPISLELVRHNRNTRWIGPSVQSEAKQRKEQILVGIGSVGFLDDPPCVVELTEAAKETVILGESLCIL